MPTTTYKVFIGYDSREPIAYEVAKHSILRNLSGENRKKVSIHPLKQKEMRELGIYTRPKDRMASTEFTFTRFWIPYLMNWQGYGLFIDCDFIVNCDIFEMFYEAEKMFNENENYAVAVCKHQYEPKKENKMDNQKQINYPRKNWASSMVFNNSHPACRKLTLDVLNNPENDGKYLLGFRWVSDIDHRKNDEENMRDGESKIAPLPVDFNWLSGEYREGEHLPEGRTIPRIIHYTLGGPWFVNERCWNYPYVDLWLDEVEMILGRKWTKEDCVDY